MWNVVETTPDFRQEEPTDPNRLVGSDRVLAVLAELARHPAGISLDALARTIDSPKPTVHRALAALRRAGFASQEGHGTYLLGDEFLRLAFTNHDGRPEHVRVLPVLEALADHFHETAHYAVLDGRAVVYRAKVDPSGGAIKLTSVIGGRNPAHCTAVGKMLLSYALPDDAAVRSWVDDGPALERRTENTHVDADSLAREIGAVRVQGFATEEQENEVGISCLAVPIFMTGSAVPTGAISISALDYRSPLRSLVDGLPTIRALVAPLSQQAAS
jgi:IclR family acetate operon transcriptional repressor